MATHISTSSTMGTKEGIRFFPEQLAYLESLFPQRVLPPSATVDELRDYFGEQKVLRAIKIRTRG